MSHDNEEWCKVWRKTDLLFQEWQNLVEFWSKQSKVSKMWTLIGPFRSIYRTFDLKKYRRVIMTLKSHVKFEEKLTCGLEMTWGEFDKLSPEHLKVPKLVVRDCQRITFIMLNGTLCKIEHHQIFYFLLFLLAFPSADISFFTNF